VDCWEKGLRAMQALSIANGKIRHEIKNPQMFETDPESFSGPSNVLYLFEKFKKKLF
jgi:hypothetical protein